MLEQHGPLRSPRSRDVPGFPVGFSMGHCVGGHHTEPPSGEGPREHHIDGRNGSRPLMTSGDVGARTELAEAVRLADHGGRRYPAAADVIEVEDWCYARDALSA